MTATPMLRALLAATALFVAAAPAHSQEYDLVIRNGRILDGAGNPWIHGDVAIEDGRIAEIGKVPGKGRVEIDASGRYVSPGWIDIMDQSATVLLENGRAENKLLQGVTTVIAGEGGPPVPAAGMVDYFARLKRQGISPNFAVFYNLTEARRLVIGDVARAPTPAELTKMKAEVTAAMQAGAIGVSTALIYPPGVFQTTEELVELASAAAPYGAPYATHMRDEGRYIETALTEAIAIGERAGIPVEIYHLKVAYRPLWQKQMERIGAMVEAARARGVDVGADVYPYVAGGTGLEVTAPSWVFADGAEKAAERLRNPAIRARLKQEIAAGGTLLWTNLIEAAGGWDGVTLMDAYSDTYARFEHRSIADIARELGRHPADAAWDIYLAGLPHRADALFFMMNEDDVRTALRFPWVSIGSDAPAAIEKGRVSLAHPRAYGTFPRIIAYYVREHGILSLPDAIRKMTSLPASRLGIGDRGLIKRGFAADLVVFDYDRIADRATYEQGEVYPDGISAVVVNGVVTAQDGRHTGAMAGTVILGPGAAPSARASFEAAPSAR